MPPLTGCDVFVSISDYNLACWKLFFFEELKQYVCVPLCKQTKINIIIIVVLYICVCVSVCTPVFCVPLCVSVYECVFVSVCEIVPDQSGTQ